VNVLLLSNLLQSPCLLEFHNQQGTLFMIQ
jgi:hypothetical protein